MDKLLLILITAVIAGNCFGHSYSTSYLRIFPQENALKSEWKIPLSDLDRVLDLDLNGDNKVSAQEVEQSQSRITRYAMSQLITEQNQIPCQTFGNRFTLDSIDSTAAIQLEFRVICDRPLSEKNPLLLDYQLFQEENPWHQGIVSVRSAQTFHQYVLSSENRRLTLAQNHSSQSSIVTFLMEGIWHIYIGLDHILFLLTLIVPVVVRRMTENRFDSDSIKPLYKQLLSIVTAFTLAHSVTLFLAASDLFRLPAQLVETGIAISVVIGALLALVPAFDRWRWLLALGFGFVHGFGFANVLAELMTPQQSILLNLVGFNIGVELGQISIVAMLVPLLLLLGRMAILRHRLLLPSMAVIICFGMVWILQRGFGITLNFSGEKRVALAARFRADQKAMQ